VKESLVMERKKTEAELLAEWRAQRPVISREQTLLAKELLQVLGDPIGDDTGLFPCYRDDGTCAWVCPGDDPSTMSDPNSPQSCCELFKSKGYECCIASLEHLLTNERK
jgi:hypothetical protein